MSEEVFLSTIPDEGKTLYEIILAQLPNEFPRPLKKFTKTVGTLDCRIKMGSRVAGRFFWQPTESRFKVFLLLEPNRFIRDRPNGLTNSTDSVLKSECFVSTEEEAIMAGKAISSCIKDLSRR